MGPGEICRSMSVVLEGAAWDPLNIAGSSGLGIHAGIAQRNHMIQVFQTHMSTCMHGYTCAHTRARAHTHTHMLNIHVLEDWTGEGDESLVELHNQLRDCDLPSSGSWELVTHREFRLS